MARRGGTPSNLIPPVKGEIRNPNGRPVGSRNRETIVRQWLDLVRKVSNPLTKVDEKLTVADEMVLKMIAKVLNESDVPAFRELMDSGFGKLIDRSKVEHSGEINIPPIKWTDGKD